MWVSGQKTPEEGTFELSTGHKWAEGSCPTTCCLCAELGWRVPLAFFTHWPRCPGNVTSPGILAAGCTFSFGCHIIAGHCGKEKYQVFPWEVESTKKRKRFFILPVS